MILSGIVAVGPRGEIGFKGGMPWPRLPDDMKHFARATAGKPVIMGRRTWDSLPAKFKPLPGRDNIVLSRIGTGRGRIDVSPHRQSSLTICHDVEGVDARLAAMGADEAFVIGGSQIYELFYPRLQKFYVTKVATIHGPAFEADAFLPVYPLPESEWLETVNGGVRSTHGGRVVYLLCEYTRVPEPYRRDEARGVGSSDADVLRKAVVEASCSLQQLEFGSETNSGAAELQRIRYGLERALAGLPNNREDAT